MDTIKNKINSFLHSVKAKAGAAANRVAAAVVSTGARTRTALCTQKGEFVVEHGAVMLIILAVAAVAIVLLKGLLNDTLAPTVQQKMMDFFN